MDEGKRGYMLGAAAMLALYALYRLAICPLVNSIAHLVYPWMF